MKYSDLTLREDFDSDVDWINRYFPGEDVDELPSDREYRNMLHLVAYDIASPNRLRKVAKVCELYGVRIEKSVFEADLDEDLFQSFWLELMDIIDEDEDGIVAYKICRSCVKETESMGIVRRPRKSICYFI